MSESYSRPFGAAQRSHIILNIIINYNFLVPIMEHYRQNAIKNPPFRKRENRKKQRKKENSPTGSRHFRRLCFDFLF